jgi:hypothetical protein
MAYISMEYGGKEMSKLPHRPAFSRPWLGRRFRLTEDSIAWGRYVVTDSGLAAVGVKQRDLLEFAFRKAEPSEVANAFADLLHLFNPRSLSSFYLEIDALFTFELAMRHVSAQGRTGYVTTAYAAARAAMWQCFEKALSVVFKAAAPVHGLNGAEFIRYRQMLHGSHLATFADDENTYDAAFSPELVLESIRRDSDSSRVWPRDT